MQDIQNGECIAICGTCGENGIIAMSLIGQFGATPMFSEVRLIRGYNLADIIIIERSKILHNETSVKVGLFNTRWNNLSSDDKERCNQVFDRIFDVVVSSAGSFGPKLVGGSKCMDVDPQSL